jgi:hypothetical protein
MVTPDGDRFFPDSSADALIFNADHGATPEHPDRWPWPGVLVGEDPEAADKPDVIVEPEAVAAPPFDPEHCPTPGMCFPYGFGPDTSHAACIHGETHAAETS